MQVLKRTVEIETTLAEDLDAPGALVVVKRAASASVDPSRLARLQHEAAVLGRLAGGAGPVLVASGDDEGRFWLAHRFVPGQTLEERLRAGPFTVDEAVRLAGGVLGQLSRAHELGVVHRDVKPANIILGPDPSGFVATLIDFGLARSPWLEPRLRDRPVGAARYVSPEQAGLLDAAVDQRSDLYSLGAVLFECLTGRPLFDGAEVGGVLHQHLTMVAPDLRRHDVAIPRALAEVIDRLVRKDPKERYQNAAAAMAAVDAIAAARRDGVDDPSEAARPGGRGGHEDDGEAASERCLAEALRLLREGHAAEAVAALDQAGREDRAAPGGPGDPAAVATWLATALRAEEETLAAGSPSRPAVRKRRRQASRAAVHLARSSPNNLPQALRERALCAAADGRTERARRLLDRSIEVAEQQLAAYQAAQSHADRGRLGLALGWSGARADHREGQEALARLAAERGPEPGRPDDWPSDVGEEGSGATVPGLARTAQFSALLDAGRAIAAATSVAAVRQAVHDAAWIILRAERCYTFEVHDDEPVPVTAGSEDPLDDMSRTLIRQAVSTGQVVAASVGLGDRVVDSLELSGVRAALCAPISQGGKVAFCFYVTHRDLVGAFGDEEQRLARFIAAVAGATLEHVAGSEAHFRALVRNSHDLTMVTDANGRTLYVSPSITRVLGYAPSDITRLDGHLVHGNDLEKVIDAFRLCRFSPATHPTVEFRTRHRDGSWRWLEVTLSNLLADDSLRGIVFNIRDVTDRKSAELALRQASEQFRLSFEDAPIGMALTSTDPVTEGWLLRVNQALADMLGYTREELEGRSVWQLTHPDDREAEQAAMVRFQTNQATSFTTDKRYRHADGHWIWVHLQSSMVRGEDGPPKYVISQLLDISERRASEERLTFLALHDPLTGLANRRLLVDRLVVALARASRTGRKVAVLYIDLDRFKGVNDMWGHECGDQLLRQAASRLSELVRESDTLARVGGDEFVLVADDLASPAEAQAVARGIVDAFQEHFDLPDGVRILLGASVGVAVASGGGDPMSVVRHADAAMYQAKERGRACFQQYRDTDN